MNAGASTAVIGHAAAPRLLYVVTEDWYFLSHRLPMARAARAAGFEVHVATRVVDGAAAIESEGFVLHPVRFARGKLPLLATLRTIAALRHVQRQVVPAVSHHVAVQASILGSLAAIGRPGARINALTGFGYIFISDRMRTRITKVMCWAIWASTARGPSCNFSSTNGFSGWTIPIHTVPALLAR